MIITLKIRLKRVLHARYRNQVYTTWKCELEDSYAQVKRGEMYLNNMHIAPYEEGNRFNHDPLRSRKLLHKREILN